MDSTKACIAVVKHLSGSETVDERKAFLNWRNESKDNDMLYNEIKILLDQPSRSSTTLLGRFTFKKINWFILTHLIGNLIAFTVGLWLTHHFSYYVLEKKSFKNLFGLMERQSVIVDETPDWLQWGVSVLAGFIVFQFINHFIETKKHHHIFRFMQRVMSKLKAEKI